MKFIEDGPDNAQIQDFSETEELNSNLWMARNTCAPLNGQ